MSLLRALRDKIIVEIPPEKEKMVGGIIVLPSPQKTGPLTGYVRAIGEGKILDNGEIVLPSVKVYDKVLIERKNLVEVKTVALPKSHPGSVLVCVKEEDIIAVIED